MLNLKYRKYQKYTEVPSLILIKYQEDQVIALNICGRCKVLGI